MCAFPSHAARLVLSGPGRVSEALSKEITVCPYQVWYNCSIHLTRRAEATMPEAFHPPLPVVLESLFMCCDDAEL